MVKSIVYTLVAAILCAAFFIWTDWYIGVQFNQFYSALKTLYDKVENKDASREDAYAVKSMWADKKEKLHIFIPHNDIAFVDYWLGETCGLIYEQEYTLALGKIEVLMEITQNLPQTYDVKLENVF